MQIKEIQKYLEENKDERGIKIWQRAGVQGLNSYGIGVTKLKALAKKIGKNHDLALKIWEEPVFELKILFTLIADCKQLTKEQINAQAKEVNFWMLSHAYCNYLLAKHPEIVELAESWIESKDEVERRCGFQLYYQIAKNSKKLPEEYFIPIVQRIEKEIQKEENFVKDAMNNALWSIGMRSKKLNQICIQTAKLIGKIDVDYGENSCEAINVENHLTSERIQKKFYG